MVTCKHSPLGLGMGRALLVIIVPYRRPKTSCQPSWSFREVKSPLGGLVLLAVLAQTRGRMGSVSYADLLTGSSSNPGPLASNPGVILSTQHLNTSRTGVSRSLPKEHMGVLRVVTLHLMPAAWKVKGMFQNTPPLLFFFFFWKAWEQGLLGPCVKQGMTEPLS